MRSRPITLTASALALVLAPSVIAVAGSPTYGSPTVAANDFDIWIDADHVRVDSDSCRNIEFRVHHTAGYLDRFTAAAEFWFGEQYVGETFDEVYESSGPLRASYYWCPSEGPGEYRLGPTRVEWSLNDAGTEGAFTDTSRTLVKLQQDQRCSIRSAKRSAKRVTIRAKFRFYSIEASSWAPMPKGTRVKFQRASRIGWETLAVVRAGDKGLVRAEATARKETGYRMRQGGNERTWACSTSVKR